MIDPSEELPVDPAYDPNIAPPERESVRVRREEEGGETRRVVGELVTEEVTDDEPDEVTLTDEERRDVSMLMTVGRRRKWIDVAGHKVQVRTLDSGDEMRIGLYTKPYLDSQGFSRAYQVGVCACGIVEIGGGQEMWDALERKPLKELTDPDDIFAKNCEALLQAYPIVISEIYNEIMKLEREFADLYIKLGKSKG